MDAVRCGRELRPSNSGWSETSCELWAEIVVRPLPSFFEAQLSVASPNAPHPDAAPLRRRARDVLARFARHPRAIHAVVALTIALASTLSLGVLRVHNLPLDDAYIHLSYGLDASFRTLFSFQGRHRDTGTSSWLWTAICILVVKLRLPEHVTLTALSIGIFSGVLLRVMALVEHALPPEVPARWLWPALSAVLVAASGNVVWLSLTGMETGLSLLLLLVVVPRLLDAGMTMGTGLLALLAIWTRIEMVIWLGLAAALLPFTGRRDARKAWRGVLLPVGGLLIYFAYNWTVSGHLLPTTALAKRASFIPSGHVFKDEHDFVFSLTRNYLRPWAPGWLVELAVIAAASPRLLLVGGWRAFRYRARLEPALAAVMVLVTGATVQVLVNVIGFRSAYHHLRYFAPALFLIPALCPVLLVHATLVPAARLLARVDRTRGQAAVRWASVGLAAMPLGWALYRDLSNFDAWARLYRQNAEQLGAVHLAVGAYLREAVPGAKRVASFDIGALRWASHLQVVDLGGVLDAEALGYLIARRPADFVRDTHAELYVSVENGWDSISPVQPSYDLVPLRTFPFREYLDPYPPHSKRMVVYRINHCGELRMLREEVGANLSFNFASANAAMRASTGMGEGSSFARWPVSADELWHDALLADGSFLSSDASDQRDRATGRFETVPMKAEGEWLSFLLAGGFDPARLRVELRSEGRVLATWTGFDSDAFVELLHPLADLRGRMFTLAVIDDAKGDWGHLMLDEVKQFVWRKSPAKPCPRKR